MAQRIRIKLNQAGVRELLKGAPMRSILADHAHAIAASAGPGHEVNVETGSKRARAEVVTSSFEAMKAEATDRNLTRAIGSAR